jgi:hypothetical protein
MKPIKPANADITKVTDDKFFHWESGKIKGGIRHNVFTKEFGLEPHECYQYDSVAEVVRVASEMQEIAGFKQVEIVTYDYNDKTEKRTTKILYRWNATADDQRIYDDKREDAV